MNNQLLESQERSKLIDITAALPTFQTWGASGIRSLVEVRADLSSIVPSSFNYNQPAGIVAGLLIDRLEKYGWLRDRPTYHALGAFLATILDIKELSSREDEDFVAASIVRYSLVADPEYLNKLRQKYDVRDDPIEAPSADRVVPRAGVDQLPDGPKFTPEFGDAEVLETVLGSEDNFLDVHLMYGALYAAQAVGRIEIPAGDPIGTGFLIGPDLLLTNKHVLKSDEYLRRAVVRFGYVNDSAGVVPSPGDAIAVRGPYISTSPVIELDYALVRLERAPLADRAVDPEDLKLPLVELIKQGKHRGFLVMVGETLIDRERVNIVQHPAGDPLKVVLTQNYVIHTKDTRIQYVADTKKGSSGSPVFNRRWEVVALHHSGSPWPPESFGDIAAKAWKGRFRVNEGISARAILEDLKRKDAYAHLPESHY